jgi:hypothetical protein
MINLALICVAPPHKIPYSARFFNGLIQIVWFSSRSRSLDSSFWPSSRLAFSGDRFWNLSYRWKISLHVNRCLRNWHSSDDRMTDFDQVFVHHVLIFIKFKILKSDFHQIHHSNLQMQLFEISHTDGKFFVYVNQFIRKRHSSLIVDIIERSASTESDQIRSDQIRSNQIKHVFIA